MQGSALSYPGSTMGTVSTHRIIYFMGFLDLLGVSLILPLILPVVNSLGASHITAGCITSLYGAIQLLSSPLAGWWSDGIGRRPVLLVCTLATALSYVLLGASSSLLVIVIARVIAGVFKHSQTMCRAVLVDVTRVQDRSHVFGTFNATSSMGFIVGPMLGGHLSELHNGFTVVCNLAAALFIVDFGIKRNRLKAHLGEWNLYSTSGELFPAVERRISKVFIHSGYNPATFLNDIALLQMNRPVDTTKTPHIAPACLPKDSYKFKDDQKCFIVGWGDDAYKPILGSNILKATSVTYSSEEEECADKLYASIPHISDEYTLDPDSQKCIVGGYGRDACTGDGGGAVVCPLDNNEAPDACHEHDCEDEHYFVAGILSFGSPVCGEDSVTIVTDIVKKINWIHTIISPAGGLKNYNYQFYDKGPHYKKRTATDQQSANNTTTTTTTTS